MTSVYALLVGINAYGGDLRPLSGCIDDVEEFEDFLAGRVAPESLHIEKLLDGQATRERIVHAFSSHLGRAGAGDMAVFYFAGHGSTEPVDEQLWFLEPTGNNQTLVCADSRRDGVPDLADKELSELLDEVAESDPHVLVILDCCHAGGGTRDPEIATDTVHVRLAPPVDKARPLSSYLPKIRAASPTRSGDMSRRSPTGVAHDPRTAISARSPLARPRHVALFACESNQVSKELPIDGRFRGVFSASLAKSFRALSPNGTYRDLLAGAAYRVRNLVGDQTAVAYATEPDDLDRPVLGGAVQRRRSTLMVEHTDGAWWVDAGRAHGIQAPGHGETTVLAVLPPRSPSAFSAGSAGTDQPLARVRAVEVELHRTRVEVDDGAELSQDRRYSAVVVSVPLPAATVELRGGGWAVDPVRQTVRVSTLVREAGPHDAGGERFVVDVGELLVVARADGTPLASGVTASEAGAAIVVRRLEHLARWHLVKGLENPVSTIAGQLEIEVVPAQRGEHPPPSPGGRDRLRPDVAGDIRLHYRTTDGRDEEPYVFVYLHNRTNRNLFCTLLDLTDRFRCHSNLFPVDQIAAGRTAVAYGGHPIGVTIPQERLAAGGTMVQDWFKLIASEHRFDAGAFELPNLDQVLERPLTRGAARAMTTIDRLAARVQKRDWTPEFPSHAPEWATAMVSVVTDRPAR